MLYAYVLAFSLASGSLLLTLIHVLMRDYALMLNVRHFDKIKSDTMDWIGAKIKCLPSFCSRHQDVHNQSYIMVMASGRWLGVRLDLLASLLIGAVSLAAVVVSQDAGR